MSTQLAQRTAADLGYTNEQVQLIKDTIAKGTTDQELALFLHVAKRTGLDPFAKQIYCIKRWDATLKREVATPQTSIDGLRLLADRTGNYAPGQEPHYEYTEDNKLHSATAYVQKWARDRWHVVAATAMFKEYAQTKRDGSWTSMWAEKPHIMLAKCAEALALRRAFPAELSGLYTSDELGTHASEAPTYEVIDAEPVAQPAQQARPAQQQHQQQQARPALPAPPSKLIERINALAGEEKLLTGQQSRELELDLETLPAPELIKVGQGMKTRIDSIKADLAAEAAQQQ